MKCESCGSKNVTMQIAQVGAETEFYTNSGIYEVGRVILIIVTLGIFLLIEAFTGRKMYRSETRVINSLFYICNDCGDVQQEDLDE